MYRVGVTIYCQALTQAKPGITMVKERKMAPRLPEVDLLYRVAKVILCDVT
jgi:hypothetical protein